MKRLACLLAAIIVLPACSSAANAGYARVSGPMPELSGTLLDSGRELTPGDYAGKVVVVNFWNPYCPPCREEQVQLEEAWRRFSDRGVLFVGVHTWGLAYPYDTIAGQAYLREFEVSYPNVPDESRGIARRFDVDQIPTTVLADRDGRMRFRILGQLRGDTLERLIAALL